LITAFFSFTLQLFFFLPCQIQVLEGAPSFASYAEGGILRSKVTVVLLACHLSYYHPKNRLSRTPEMRYILLPPMAKVKRNKKGAPMTQSRCLQDLISVGPAIERDFHLLGIHSVSQLAKHDPHKLYTRLEHLTGQHQDPCVLDTFQAAVAQARNPRLPAEKCQWWYWSRKRKAAR